MRMTGRAPDLDRRAQDAWSADGDCVLARYYLLRGVEERSPDLLVARNHPSVCTLRLLSDSVV